ncbi:MAG: nitrous oxide-stimulated promoter family protein [Bacteroidales bacterium]|jgi:hypothetical protein|nr:nitrous oxide-stimulated promoter family protein [Bacteroidales bacterium]
MSGRKNKRRSKIERERLTVLKMIEIYYRGHKRDGSCSERECRELSEYAEKKLLKCPFGENKGSCRKCKIHCYSPEMRIKIKKVIRYSGPRMILYTPLEFFRHV